MGFISGDPAGRYTNSVGVSSTKVKSKMATTLKPKTKMRTRWRSCYSRVITETHTGECHVDGCKHDTARPCRPSAIGPTGEGDGNSEGDDSFMSNPRPSAHAYSSIDRQYLLNGRAADLRLRGPSPGFCQADELVDYGEVYNPACWERGERLIWFEFQRHKSLTY